ncbi:MAG: DUF3604 domain-containing protein [Halioglobus sp.]
MNRWYTAAILTPMALAVSCSKFEDASLQPAFDSSTVVEPVSKPVVAANPDKNVFFGDLHIHTSLSSDAYVFGVRSLPEDVYTFAKGGTIEHGAGYPIKIGRPLDFVAVTDHAEYMGQARLAGLDVPTTERPLRETLLNSSRLGITRAWFSSTNYIRKNGFGLGVDVVDTEVNKSAWDMTIDAAQRHNEPGAFTAFIAYEWSAFAGESTVHIHRNVIYRSDAVSNLPFSYVDSPKPEDLWTFLDQENSAGRHAFAIPHNANLSDGNMYANRDSNGQPLTAEYAAMRSRYEPVSEIFQVKGSSETHPLLSGLDEFANFELTTLVIGGGEPEIGSVKGSYIRDALRVGMELSHSEGFNPFKFGVIGSSDSHNASSPTDEANYHGKLPMLDGSAGLRTDEATLLPEGLNPATRWGSGGLAAVWAEENTRASLYDALANKETFATSGPRISVRFFAGWDYEPKMLEAPDFVKKAYAGGVPMGGQLTPGPVDKSPQFIVLAMKDPEGANLDRVQIIKAWVDGEGTSHEKVFDVAASDNRTLDVDTGKVVSVGNTVDIATATYTNTIGDETLSTLWTDPEFKSQQQALYYARVIEIPTPRWSTYDARTLGTEPMDPATIQERAVTSAIWYQGDDLP